jgi:Fe-S oxidoreductase
MTLPTGKILGILADNLERRGSVLPLSKRASTRWAKGLDIPLGGETVLYTGHMYQLIPAIDALAGQMARLENSVLAKLIGLGRVVNRVVNLSFFMQLGASKALAAEYDAALRSIAVLLKGAGVEFGYLYGEELYSGALVFDEGMDAAFRRHARRVAEVFRKNGVKRVITVDPHTTNMLREVYPQFIEGFDLEVFSYLEVLAEKRMQPTTKLEGEIVIHDSCLYARAEKMTSPPRELLVHAGIDVLEPALSGADTHCCGGPIEALFPSEAHRISGNRVKQLSETGSRVVAMCPICLVNLRKAAAEVENALEVTDISSFLSRASPFIAP